MTAIEVAVNALTALSQDKSVEPSVRCSAAQSLLILNHEGGFLHGAHPQQYNKHGQPQ